jgi:hypothetical protein
VLSSYRRALDARDRGAASRAFFAARIIQRATRPGQERRRRRRRNEERAAEDGGERGDKQRWARVEEFLGLESHAAARTGTARGSRVSSCPGPRRPPSSHAATRSVSRVAWDSFLSLRLPLNKTK